MLMTKEAWIHRQKARGRDRFKEKPVGHFMKGNIWILKFSILLEWQ
jgi:hypothetical protein